MYRPGYRAVYRPAWPGSSSAHYPIGSLVPPGSATKLWFDGQDPLGTGVRPADLAAITTWVSKGSQSGCDITQAVAGAKPTFLLVGQAGKLNNLSAISFDGGDELLSANFTALTQPTLIAIIKRQNNLSTSVYYDGKNAGNRNAMYATAANHTVNAGTDIACTTVTPPVANQYDMVVTTYNAASSVIRINGVSKGLAGSPGAQVLDGFRVGQDIGGPGFGLTGQIAEIVICSGGVLPTAAEMEAYLVAKYGAFPQ